MSISAKISFSFLLYFLKYYFFKFINFGNWFKHSHKLPLYHYICKKIYDETIWVCKNPVVKPVFQKFARNSRKADIFTEDELITMFSNYELWDSYDEYLLFYTIYTCGLRLGEARALQVNQFIFDENILKIHSSLFEY